MRAAGGIQVMHDCTGWLSLLLLFKPGVQVVHAQDLSPVPAFGEAPALLAVAAFFGGVRLIDNCQLSHSSPAAARCKLRQV